MSAHFWEAATVFLGGVATLAIFSFLIKENPFYRLFEHLFIGIAAGLTTVLGIKTFLWPKIIVPMLGLDIVVFPDGTLSREYQPLYLLYLLPMIVGCFYYFIYSRSYSWLAKIVIGISLGASAGLAFKAFFIEMIPQVVSSFKPLFVLDAGTINWGASVSNWVFLFSLFSVMYYFFFSFKVETGTTRRMSVAGRWVMMVCFGAFFGSTVMARMALLVERVSFLVNDWWGVVVGVFA
jgi:hypothetical protein